MAGGRRGLVAPQNTFLENIVRRSNGKRCIRVLVAQACYPCLSCSRLPPLGASSCSRNRSAAGSRGAGARAASRRMGKVGRAGQGLMGPHWKERALLGMPVGFLPPSLSPQRASQMMSKVLEKVMGGWTQIRQEQERQRVLQPCCPHPSAKALRALGRLLARRRLPTGVPAVEQGNSGPGPQGWQEAAASLYLP